MTRPIFNTVDAKPKEGSSDGKPNTFKFSRKHSALEVDWLVRQKGKLNRRERRALDRLTRGKQ